MDVTTKGYGNPVRYGKCEKMGNCFCHTGTGIATKILVRKHEVAVSTHAN